MPVLCTIYLALIWDYTRIAKWRSLYPKNHYLPSINRGNSCFSYIFGYNVYSYANIIIGKNINVLLYKISNMLKASWILILQTESQNIFSINTNIAWVIIDIHDISLSRKYWHKLLKNVMAKFIKMFLAYFRVSISTVLLNNLSTTVTYVKITICLLCLPKFLLFPKPKHRRFYKKSQIDYYWYQSWCLIPTSQKNLSVIYIWF